MTPTPSLHPLRTLTIHPDTSPEVLRAYAYLLDACRFPASVILDSHHAHIVSLCRRHLTRIADILISRFTLGDRDPILVSTLCEYFPHIAGDTVRDAANLIAARWHGQQNRGTLLCLASAITESPTLRKKFSRWLTDTDQSTPTPGLTYFEAAAAYLRAYPRAHNRRDILRRFGLYLDSCDLTLLTPLELLTLHSLSPLWYDLRALHGLDLCTRALQHTIATTLASLSTSSLSTTSCPHPSASLTSTLSSLLTLTETLESANYATLCGTMEDMVKPDAIITGISNILV